MICYSSDLEVSCSRNYNIMRPLSFRPDALRTLLLRNKIATLDELKQSLGTPVVGNRFQAARTSHWLALLK